MNTASKKIIRTSSLAAFALIVSGCSERNDSAQVAPPEPLVSAPTVQTEVAGTDATLQNGPMKATYTPYYKDDQLQRIVERRTLGDTTAEGEYEFTGARLVKYRGAPLEESGELTIELDITGAVLNARKDDAPASDADVRAILNRASLLRNHALARQASSTHPTY